MQRTPVENSSNISAIGYDPHNQVLQVEFLSKGKAEADNWVYTYQNVPADVATAFFEAESKGAFHARAIRDKTEFPFTRHKRADELAQELADTLDALRALIATIKAEGRTPERDAAYHAYHGKIRALRGDDMPSFIRDAAGMEAGLPGTIIL